MLREGPPAYVPFYELAVGGLVMENLLGKKISDRASTVDFFYRAGYDYVPVWPGVPAKRGSLVDRSQGYPIQDRAGCR